MSHRGWIAALVCLVLPLIQSACETGSRSPADTRLEIVASPTYAPMSMAISPDGEQIVYVAEELGPPQLWVYSLESERRRPLTGTEQAREPFWSPDGRFIGFFADGLVKTIDVDSGAIEVLMRFPTGTAGSWNAEGVIILAGTATSLMTVPATGGPYPGQKRVVSLRPGQRSLRTPYFLPDGRHFLYQVAGVDRGLYLSALEEWEIEILRIDPADLSAEQREGIMARLPSTLNPGQRAVVMARLRNTSDTLPTRRVERLLDAESGGVYHPSGHLLYVRDGTLYAHGFDLGEMGLTGDEFKVTDEGISWIRGASAALSTSTAGHLVYRARTDSAGARQLTWLDRHGNELERIGGPLTGPADPELSPDGSRVAFHARTRDQGLDIYTLNRGGGEPEPFASQPGTDYSPAWSPDGEEIAFLSLVRGTSGEGLVRAAADGSGIPVRMLATPGNLRYPVISDWSNDGRFLALRPMGTRGYDIWGVEFDGEWKAPFPIVTTSASEHGSQFSHDVRWIAYHSDETGRFEIYVQPFPGSVGRVGPVSSDGGTQVRWREDGRELFYVSLDGWLMSVSVESSGPEESIRFGTPARLFEAGVSPIVRYDVSQHEYAVSSDGQRFLVVRMKKEESPITVLPNWRPGG